MQNLIFNESADFRFHSAESMAKDIILGLGDVQKDIKLLIMELIKPFEPKKQIGIARAVGNYCYGNGKTTSSYDSVNKLLEEIYSLIDNPILIYSYGKQKQPYYSTELPLNSQFPENWGWENSSQFYELDTEFQDKEYFQNIEPVDICHLVRKMDNFLMERGISYKFLRNYEHVLRAFNSLDEPQNNPTDESYYD